MGFCIDGGGIHGSLYSYTRRREKIIIVGFMCAS
jgi:hypothetical protein